MDAVSSLRRGWLMLCESIDRGGGGGGVVGQEGS